MLARKKLQEAEWEDLFRTEAFQQLLVHALSSNTPMQRGLNQALSDIVSTRKRVALGCLFLCLGFTRLESRYNGVTMRDEDLLVEDMDVATDWEFCKFPYT